MINLSNKYGKIVEVSNKEIACVHITQNLVVLNMISGERFTFPLDFSNPIDSAIETKETLKARYGFEMFTRKYK